MGKALPFFAATLTAPLGLLVGLGTACAQTPPAAFPQGAQLLLQQAEAVGLGVIATGPWSKSGGLPAERIEAGVTAQAWRMPASGLTTAQLMLALRVEAEASGFVASFSCRTTDCGGFDFRFAIPTLPEPDMHVDLGDFHYLALQKSTAFGTEHRIYLISRGPGQLFAQITAITPLAAAASAPVLPGTETPAAQTATPPGPEAQPPAPSGGALVAALLSQGGAPLDDLVFAPGAADLAAGDYASLQELGAWLLGNPKVTVALVGHTDATGGLDGNIALSKRRAESVRRWLLDNFDLPKAQLAAEGMGYLAPRATNSTPEGQAKNRRVEVIMTSTR